MLHKGINSSEMVIKESRNRNDHCLIKNRMNTPCEKQNLLPKQLKKRSVDVVEYCNIKGFFVIEFYRKIP